VSDGNPWRELVGITAELGDDELCVLVRIAERLKGGMGVYGELRIAVDRREFRKTEAWQEIEDALVYLACAWLKDLGGGQ
jgi:hypothetical protein